MTPPRSAPTATALRRDIQALRAIAVLLVVLNHLWPAWLGGGYVGVDVFFVISGYLITLHLLKEVQRSDRVSLPRFYARRARRLLPAALVVALVSLAGALVLLPPERWQRVTHEIFAASAYFENWLLSASSVDYWAHEQFATPVQHYWSLSVEEQFYLLWPVTLLLLGWLFARRRPGRIAARRGVLGTAVALLAVTSFVFAVWQTAVARDATYFNTAARVWEFMLGGLLAVAAPKLNEWFENRGRRGWLLVARGVAQLLGYAAIVWAAIAFTAHTLFPGPWALLPVVGTALVIAAGPEMPHWSPARALQWRPVQVLGDVSYSLYLWHWPLIVFAPFALRRVLSGFDLLGILLLSVLLAWVTKRFIEDPGRSRLFTNLRPRVTLLATGGSVALIGAAVFGAASWGAQLEQQRAAAVVAAQGTACFGANATASDSGCRDPFGAAIYPAGGASEAPWLGRRAPECAEAPSDEQIRAAGKPSLIQCDFTASEAERKQAQQVWLVGDSHAEHWQGAVIEVARSNGWLLSRVSYGGCPTVPVPASRFDGRKMTAEKRKNCLEWSTAVNERIKQERPGLVLVSNFASAEELDDGTGRSQVEQLVDGMQVSLVEWAKRGARVVVLRDIPVGGKAMGVECVVSSRGAIDEGCAAPESEVLPPDPMVDAVKQLDHKGISSIDLTDSFCRDGLCSGVIGGLPVYYDTNHMSLSFSRSLASTLHNELGAILGRNLSE